MTQHLEALLADLVLASRILAAENIVDSFGHISARHPEHGDRFFISRVRAAELVTRDDIVELDLACTPLVPTESLGAIAMPILVETTSRCPSTI